MTRIDPITVLDSYRWTGLHPSGTVEWLYRDIDGHLRACPLVAVSLAAKGKKHNDVLRFATEEYGINSLAAFIRVMCDSHGQMSEVYGIMRKLLDISRPYLHGYMWGYDRWPLDPLDVYPDHQDYELGYWDGGLAKAVLDAMDYRLHERDFNS